MPTASTSQMSAHSASDHPSESLSHSTHHNVQWNADCIKERFTIVKNEITTMNSGNKKLMISLVIGAFFILLVLTFFSFEKRSGMTFLGIVAIIALIAISLIFLIINTSEKCQSKLSICLLTLDDKNVFFQSLSEVSCGGDAIKYFLQFVDKATKIAEVVTPGANVPAASQPKSEEKADGQ